jgi:hypothetical protein
MRLLFAYARPPRPRLNALALRLRSPAKTASYAGYLTEATFFSHFIIILRSLKLLFHLFNQAIGKT